MPRHAGALSTGASEPWLSIRTRRAACWHGLTFSPLTGSEQRRSPGSTGACEVCGTRSPPGRAFWRVSTSPVVTAIAWPPGAEELIERRRAQPQRTVTSARPGRAIADTSGGAGTGRYAIAAPTGRSTRHPPPPPLRPVCAGTLHRPVCSLSARWSAAERSVFDRELWPATHRPFSRCGHPVCGRCSAAGRSSGTCGAGRGWPDHRLLAVCA